MNKKIFSIVLMLCFALNLSVSAQFTDIQGHWAQTALEKWNKNGIIAGYEDATIRPDNNITAAELCTLLNRLLNVEQGESTTFADVSDSAWYYGEVAGAEAAGYISNDAQQGFYPDAGISRGRAAATISRAFMLTSDEEKTLPFEDVDETNEYYNEIKTMYDNGFIQGKSENRFAPDDTLTRAEVVTMFENIIDNYHNNYTDIEGQQIEGSLLITKSNIMVKDTTINGDLFISRGVSGGELRLDNVTVNGKVYYCGANQNVLILKNSNIDKIVSDANDARIILYQNSTVNTLESYGNVILSEIFATGEGYKNVVVAEGGVLSVAGRVQSCEVYETSVLNVLQGGEIAEVVVEAAAVNTTIISEGKISKITNNASSIIVNGSNKSSGEITGIASVSTEDADKMYVVSLSAGSTRPKNSYTIESGFTSTGDNSTYLSALDIEELSLSGVKRFSPEFKSDIFTYELVVKNAIDTLNILPTASKKQTNVKINGDSASTDEHNSISLPVGESELTIDLYLGLSKKCTYVINVNRMEAVSSAILNKISNNTDSITVDDLVAAGIDGIVKEQLGAYKDAIKATAEAKGDILTDDEIQEIVNSCNSSVAELGSLVVTNSTVYTNGYNLMLHNFSTEQTKYMAYVDKSISDVDITFTKLHEDSVVKINGKEAQGGTPNKVSGLLTGENEIELTVISADGTSTKTYTIIVDKDSGSTLIENSNFGSGTGGWSLGKTAPANGELNLTQNPGWVTVVRKADGTGMWQLGIKSTTFQVPSATTVTIEFLASTVGGVEGEVDRTINVMRKVGSGSELSAISGNNTGNVELVNGKAEKYTFSTGGKASDGLTTCYIYIQTGNSKDGDEADVMFKYIRVSYEGADGSIKSLNIVGNGTPLTLSPAFSPDITEYTATVASNISQLIVTTGGGVNSNTVVKVNGSTNALNFVPIQQGINTIEIDGTSPTGNVKKYRIKVIKE